MRLFPSLVVIVLVLALAATTIAARQPDTAPRIVTNTSPSITAASRCTASALNDLQINQCLVRDMTLLERQMTGALGRESLYLSATSRRQARDVVQRAQTAFLAYAHRECLAEANPYLGGTIVPIIYGECSLSLYRQRLMLIVEQTRYLQRGGLAAPSH